MTQTLDHQRTVQRPAPVTRKLFTAVKMQKVTNPVTAEINPPKTIAIGQKLAPPVWLVEKISRIIIHEENTINGEINEST